MAKIQGLDRLKRKLKRLQQQTAEPVGKALLRAGGVIVAEQKRLAPKETGKLRDSIGAHTATGKRKHAAFQGGKFLGTPNKDAKVFITAGNSEVRYAHLVEFGSAPHKIKPKNRKALKTGPEQFSAEADHPGAEAQPFFFPGYRATRRKARSIIGKAVRDSVKKAVK